MHNSMTSCSSLVCNEPISHTPPAHIRPRSITYDIFHAVLKSRFFPNKLQIQTSELCRMRMWKSRWISPNLRAAWAGKKILSICLDLFQFKKKFKKRKVLQSKLTVEVLCKTSSRYSYKGKKIEEGDWAPIAGGENCSLWLSSWSGFFFFFFLLMGLNVVRQPDWKKKRFSSACLFDSIKWHWERCKHLSVHLPVSASQNAVLHSVDD